MTSDGARRGFSAEPLRKRAKVAVLILCTTIPLSLLAKAYGAPFVGMAIAGWALTDERPLRFRLAGEWPNVAGKLLILGGAVGFVVSFAFVASR